MQYMYIRRRDVVRVTRSSNNLKPAELYTLCKSHFGGNTLSLFSVPCLVRGNRMRESRGRRKKRIVSVALKCCHW